MKTLLISFGFVCAAVFAYSIADSLSSPKCPYCDAVTIDSNIPEGSVYAWNECRMCSHRWLSAAKDPQ